MSQNHSIEAVLTARDEGFSSALNNAIALIGNVTKVAESLGSVAKATESLNDSKTVLGGLLDRVEKSMGSLSLGSKGLIGSLGKVGLALGKVGLAIAAVAAAVAGLIIWWRDLQTRNEELADRFRAIWDGIKSVFQSAVDRIGGSLRGLADNFGSLWSTIAPVVAKQKRPFSEPPSGSHA